MAVVAPAVEEAVELMRRLGIRVLSVSGLHIELGPPPLPAGPPLPDLPPQKRCNCPHDEASHEGGICLEGCDPSECAGKGVSRG